MEFIDSIKERYADLCAKYRYCYIGDKRKFVKEIETIELPEDKFMQALIQKHKELCVVYRDAYIAKTSVVDYCKTYMEILEALMEHEVKKKDSGFAYTTENIIPVLKLIEEIATLEEIELTM